MHPKHKIAVIQLYPKVPSLANSHSNPHAHTSPHH